LNAHPLYGAAGRSDFEGVTPGGMGAGSGIGSGEPTTATLGGASAAAVARESGSRDGSTEDVEAQLFSSPRPRPSCGGGGGGSCGDGDGDGGNGDGDSEEAPQMSKLYKYYTVGLLTLASMFLYADQNLISPNLSAVAEDFGFDEREKAGLRGGHAGAEPQISSCAVPTSRA
jgi:hypothetical protein